MFAVCDGYIFIFFYKFCLKKKMVSKFSFPILDYTLASTINFALLFLNKMLKTSQKTYFYYVVVALSNASKNVFQTTYSTSILNINLQPCIDTDIIICGTVAIYTMLVLVCIQNRSISHNINNTHTLCFMNINKFYA